MQDFKDQDKEVLNALESFKFQLQEKQIKKQKKQILLNNLIHEKDRIMLPMRKFLFEIEKLRLIVSNSEQFSSPSRQKINPQVFRVFEFESSPRWSPGNSLIFDHPAQVEIAIPNPNDRHQTGVIVIHFSSNHPDSEIAKGPFFKIDDAINALSKFLLKNTIKSELNSEKPI